MYYHAKPDATTDVVIGDFAASSVLLIGRDGFWNTQPAYFHGDRQTAVRRDAENEVGATLQYTEISQNEFRELTSNLPDYASRVELLAALSVDLTDKYDNLWKQIRQTYKELTAVQAELSTLSSFV